MGVYLVIREAYNPMKTFAETFKVTEKEKEFIVEFLAERFKNYVFMNAAGMTRQGLLKIWGEDWQGGDKIILNYKCSQVLEDAIEALGGFRRGRYSKVQPNDRPLSKMRRYFGSRPV